MGSYRQASQLAKCRENHIPTQKLKRSKKSNSCSIMSELPTDIIYSHIFSRLPVKSVLRFRSVCKQWCTLLSDPQFARMHLNHIPKDIIPQKLLIRSSSKAFHSLDYEEASSGNANATAEPLNFPLKAPHSVELLGSCNGLVCVAVPHKKNGGDSNIVLWNPSTGDHKMLPDPDLPISTFHVLGFGYDLSLDDYKMVRVIPDSEYRLDIYSLKSNSWITVIGDAPHHILSRFYTQSRGSSVNGSIYWLLHRSFLSRDYDVIVRFDLKDAMFREVALPRDLNHRVCTHLKVVGGCVGITKVICDHGPQRRNAEVWRMKEDSEEPWTKLTTISARDCGVVKFMEPVCFSKNGKVLMFYDGELGNPIVSCKSEKKFVFYDPKRSSILEDFSVDGLSACFEEITYIETLVSPNVGDGKADIY